MQLRAFKMLMNFSNKSDGFFWNNINQRVLHAQYAVRGTVPTLATQMQEQIKNNPNKFPFNSITYCNIGNPQAFHQKPVTYYRQVLSCLLDPNLIRNESINPDAAKKAQSLLKEIISVGSYTHSLGIPMIRNSVANFISNQDRVDKPTIDNIFLTQGASQGVHLLINTLITNPKDAIMIPIPQYPLYSAAITLYGGSAAPYYLDQERGWQLDLQELSRSIIASKQIGNTVKALVVINPGNPTGALFSANTIKKIIQFSVANKLVIIADEVYRENIYKEEGKDKKLAKFVSFRSALNEMPKDTQAKCELASLHSVSKGLLGECGLRGGYLYLHNFNPKVKEQLVKLKSINLCSNAVGQGMIEMMVNKPLSGVSQATTTQFIREYSALFQSLKRKAAITTINLNKMKNITCNEVQGAMYAFPSIKFSQKAVKAAGELAPDLFYCLYVLKNTGIVLVPGSGFGQKAGTHHFRMTILIPQSELQKTLGELSKCNNRFHEQYE